MRTIYAEGNVSVSNVQCDSLTASRLASQYTLIQHTFQNNVQDLVITEHAGNASTSIHQVTFGRNSGHTSPLNPCFFKPLAFQQGGKDHEFWGWHILWSEPQGLFYARMDGEAWVSSLPKRLSKLSTNNIQFKQENQNITITWQQIENNINTNMEAISTDDGRSWEVTAY